MGRHHFRRRGAGRRIEAALWAIIGLALLAVVTAPDVQARLGLSAAPARAAVAQVLPSRIGPPPPDAPPPPARRAATFTGRVVQVADGDTLPVRLPDGESRRVRLAEIDAPEKDQPYADRSRRELARRVVGRTIEVAQTDTDDYGRAVGRVFVDGRDVNRELVADGAAWAFRRYLRDPTLVQVELTARSRGVGLWSEPPERTVAPWQWREGVRSPSAVPIQGFAQAAPTQPVRMFNASGDYRCGKRYCRQMSSCEEARFHLRRCGVSTLDGDGDGVPCEIICRR